MSSAPLASRNSIDRRAKDALWHLAGLWARIMYLLIILNIIVGIIWVLVILGAVTATYNH